MVLVRSLLYFTIEHDCLEKIFQEKEVLKLLQDLNVNKSPGPDGLHPKMLKELSEALVKPITITYNTSVSSRYSAR